MNKYIILVGKSASGKDTILNEFVSNNLAKPLISHTTRPIRDGEKNGISYHFCNTKEFQNMIADNELIEYRTYETNVSNIKNLWYYGLKKCNTKIKKDRIVILDIQGAKDFISYYGEENCIVFYINVDRFTRKKRCLSRGDYNKSEWNRRLKADKYDFRRSELKSINANIMNGKKSTMSIFNQMIEIVKREKR